MLAIFLSFRVAGAAAAWIAAVARQARVGRIDGSGKIRAAAGHAPVENPRRREMLLNAELNAGTSISAMSVAETHAASERSREPPRIAGICAE